MLALGLKLGVKWFAVEQPPGNAAWETQVANDLRGYSFHVARFEFGAYDVGAPYLRRRVYIIASASLPRLEVARKEVPRAIKRVKRSADTGGDWNADKLRSIPISASDADEDPHERKEWIEALGDSNPPHMAEVIGRALTAAEWG